MEGSFASPARDELARGTFHLHGYLPFEASAGS